LRGHQFKSNLRNRIKMYPIRQQVKRQLTLVLPIVGLGIETISSGNSVVLRFGA
jgi:hypothetical protein